MWNLCVWLFRTVYTMKGNFHVWCVSVNSFFVNWVCANSPGIKEFVFWKKMEFWALKEYGVSCTKWDFLFRMLCDNFIKRIAMTVSLPPLTDYRGREWKEKKPIYEICQSCLRHHEEICKCCPFCRKYCKLYKIEQNYS